MGTMAFALASLMLAAPAADTQVEGRFEPATEVIVSPGTMRASYVTVYTLVEHTRRESFERWRVRLPEKYRKHWVSETGVVWVLIEAVPGPSPGSVVWLAADTLEYGKKCPKW